MYKKTLMFVSSIILLSACSGNSQNIELGKIETSANQNAQTVDKDIKFEGSRIISDIYQKNSNKEIYLPKQFNFTDKNGITYKRLNIPEYGISALVPTNFGVYENSKILNSENSSMISIFGKTDQVKNIQISFYSRLDNQKNEAFVQKSFFNDIMDHYVHVRNNNIYRPILFKNGELKSKYSEKNVLIDNSKSDYMELIDGVGGINVSHGKKLLTRTETPSEFRLKIASKEESYASPNLLINYGIVFDKGTVVITSYYNEQKDIAEEINKVVSESIAYIDVEQTAGLSYTQFDSKKIGEYKLNIPKSFKETSGNIHNSLFIDENIDFNFISRNNYLFVYHDVVSKNNKSVLDTFNQFENFKNSFMNKFYSVNTNTTQKPIVISELNRYYRRDFTVTEGLYQNITNKSDSGVYKAFYRESTGEIYVFMMNSSEFTNDIYKQTLNTITNQFAN